jgi:tripartite ATP-independent transporter DctP family solute receptor
MKFGHQLARGAGAALTALGLVLGAGAALAEEWKFAIEENVGDVQHRYAEKFKELVEARTDGDVTVNIYPYGQLGTENDITELAAAGAVQFSNASPGHLGTFVPEVQVLLLPYLLSENPEVNKKVLSESEALYGNLEDDFARRNLKLYHIYPEGEMVWTSNKEIRSPEDLAGVKFRVMTSPILVEAVRAYGGDPVALPWGEVYSGLQLGTIDAQVNPIFFIESAKFHEVQDALTWTGEQEYTTTVVANQAFWDSLPEERREMLRDIRDELADYIYEEQQEMNEASRARIKEAKPDISFVELTPEERAAFRERAQKLDEVLVREVGGDVAQTLEQLRSEIQAAEQELGAGDAAAQNAGPTGQASGGAAAGGEGAQAPAAR